VGGLVTGVHHNTIREAYLFMKETR